MKHCQLQLVYENYKNFLYNILVKNSKKSSNTMKFQLIFLLVATIMLMGCSTCLAQGPPGGGHGGGMGGGGMGGGGQAGGGAGGQAGMGVGMSAGAGAGGGAGGGAGR